MSVCRRQEFMPTNLKLDDKMGAEAVRPGRHKTKRQAVSAALSEYVRPRRQARIEDLYGTIELSSGMEC